MQERSEAKRSEATCHMAMPQWGERKWVERNGSNRPPVPWVESSPFRNWVEWTWVDLEKCQVQGRQHIDFDPSPFDPIRTQSIRPQSIRPKLFDQKGRPNSFRPISFDPFHAIRLNVATWRRERSDRAIQQIR